MTRKALVLLLLAAAVLPTGRTDAVPAAAQDGETHGCRLGCS